MEEYLTQTKSATSYYQNIQNNYYHNAQVRERTNILNNMQNQFEYYSNNSPFKDNNITQQTNIDNEAINESNTNQNTSQINNIFKNLNLSNLSSLLNGGNFQNVLLNILSKENNSLGNILKLIQNPMIKNSFSKKHNKKTISTGDNIETKNEIDSYEKIEN